MTASDPTPRVAARVLLIDEAGRLLLFRASDPGRPGVGYWFTVGGGLDPGESAVDAAVRELREETGLVLPPEAFGAPVFHERTDFPFDGVWYRQEQDFFVARVQSFEVNLDGHNAVERESIDSYRWWSVDELAGTAELFYPAALIELLRGILE